METIHDCWDDAARAAGVFGTPEEDDIVLVLCHTCLIKQKQREAEQEEADFWHQLDSEESD